mgnify:CR=1 FL=1
MAVSEPGMAPSVRVDRVVSGSGRAGQDESEEGPLGVAASAGQHSQDSSSLEWPWGSRGWHPVSGGGWRPGQQGKGRMEGWKDGRMERPLAMTMTVGPVLQVLIAVSILTSLVWSLLNLQNNGKERKDLYT